MTLKELIIRTVDELVAAGKTEFTTAEICETALQIDPTRKRRSVLGTLPGLVVGRSHPVYTIEDQFLDKVGHGIYKIYQPPEEKKTSRTRKRKRR